MEMDLSKIGESFLKFLSCVVCENHTYSPVMTCPAGHVTCQICIVKLNQNTNGCSTCTLPVTKNDAVTRYLGTVSYIIPCRFSSEGCRFLGLPSCFPKHYFTCFYRDIQCALNDKCDKDNRLIEMSLISAHWMKDHNVSFNEPDICVEDFQLVEYKWNVLDNGLLTINCGGETFCLRVTLSEEGNICGWIFSPSQLNQYHSKMCDLEIKLSYDHAASDVSRKSTVIFRNMPILNLRLNGLEHVLGVEGLAVVYPQSLSAKPDVADYTLLISIHP